jgi:hypothetical protein
MMVPTTNVNASVTSAKSSPRTPFDAEHDGAERNRQHDRHQRSRRQRPQERHVEPRSQRGRRVHSRAEECAVAKREVAGVTRQDVPRRGEHDPVEDQVAERLVEERQAEHGHGRESGPHDRHRDPDAIHPAPGIAC